MQLSDKSKKKLAIAYVLFLVFISAIRLLNNDFWGDECWSIVLGRMNVKSLLLTTSYDVHPPLYYLIIKLLILIFGDNYFVYNLSSFIPYLLLILFGYTVIYKHKGSLQFLVYVTLLTISNMTLVFNHQVRMYSWASLLFILAFYEMLKILQKRENINYVLFGVFSLLAAYTHYYSLVAVSFLYFFIIIKNIKEKKDLSKTIILIIGSIIGYLPWLMILIQTFVRTSSDFWMQNIPTFYDSIKWIFSFSNDFITNTVLVMYAIYFVCSVRNLFNKLSNKESIDFCSFDVINILFCISFLGTVLTGIVVSYVIRPLYETRFLYQFVPLLMIIISFIIDDLCKRFKNKRVSVIVKLFVILIFASQYIHYFSIIRDEFINCKTVNQTISEMRKYIKDDTLLLTDEFLYEWTVLECYFPNNEIKNIAEVKLSQLSNTMLVINANSDDLKEELKNHTNIRMVEEKGYLGEVHNTIYYVD